MNAKSFFAFFAAFLILFFGGWLVYGIILMDFVQAHTTNYEGLMKMPPSMLSLVVSNVLYALLLVIVFNWANVKSVTKGSVTGAILFFLMAATFDSSVHAFMNLHDSTFFAVDIIVFAVLGALMGAVAGGIMGRGNAA